MSSSTHDAEQSAEQSPFTHPFQVPAFRAYLVVRLCTILGATGMSLIIAWQAYNIARLTMSPGESAAQDRIQAGYSRCSRFRLDLRRCCIHSRLP